MFTPELKDYQRILEHIPMGIAYVGKDFRLRHLNSYFLEKLGMTIEHVRGQHCYKISAEVRGEKADKPCSHCQVPEALANDEIKTFISEISPDLIIENTTVPVKDDGGEVVGAIELLRDITGRVKMEKEILYRKELLESITEAIEEAIILLSKDLKIQWANRKFKEQSGYSDKEILGKHCYEITHRRSDKCMPPKDLCPIEDVIKTGHPKTEIHIHFDKKGRECYTEVTAYPIKEKDEIISYVHVARDVSDRITAEMEIKKLKDFNENIVQSMEEGITIENDEGYITFANPRMLQMLKKAKDEVIGGHWTEIFSPLAEKSVMEENSKVKNGSSARYEATLKSGEGELEVMVSSTPLTEDELYVGNLKVFVDITERKEAEEKLREKAIKYKIERGKSYLIKEQYLDKGLDILNDFIQAGYRGMVISRTTPEDFKDIILGDVEILWLSEKKGRDVVPPDLNVLRKNVEDFLSRNSVVLLDRLDYLIVQKGFNDVLRFLEEIIETVYLSKGVLLVVVDPETLNSQELSLLEKDFLGVEPKFKIELSDELREILQFVKKENLAGRKPVHKDVARESKITRPTAIKRIRQLKNKGLLVGTKRGRFKVLELTEKGREIG